MILWLYRWVTCPNLAKQAHQTRKPCVSRERRNTKDTLGYGMVSICCFLRGWQRNLTSYNYSSLEQRYNYSSKASQIPDCCWSHGINQQLRPPFSSVDRSPPCTKYWLKKEKKKTWLKGHFVFLNAIKTAKLEQACICKSAQKNTAFPSHWVIVSV